MTTTIAVHNTIDDKLAAISALQNVRSNGMQELTRLNSASDPLWRALDGADEELSQSIDNLVDNAIEDWLADAKQAVKDANDASAGIQAAIKDIQDITKKFAAAGMIVGYLDKAIQTAQKLLPLAAAL